MRRGIRRDHTLWIVILTIVSFTLFAAATALADQSPRKKIIAAIPEDFPPTYFLDRETGKPSGFAVDLLTLLANQAGLEVQYLFCRPWEECHQFVVNGKADLIPNIVENQTRRQLFAFSHAVETTSVNYIARASDASSAPAPGMKIGVMRSSAAYEYLAKHPELQTHQVLYDSLTHLLFDLLAAKIDLAATATNNIMKLAIETGVDDKLHVIDPPIQEGKRVLMLRKDDTELMGRLNRAIDLVVASPKYREIYVKWFGKPKPYWTTRRILIVVLATALLVFLAAAFWRLVSIRRVNMELRIEIDERKKAEAMLYDEMEKSRAILSGIGDGVAMYDRNFTILFQNEVVKSMLGDHVGKVCYRSLHDREGICEGCPVELVYQDGQVHRSERTPDNVRFFHITASPMRDDQGNIVGSVEVFREVTEQRRIQHEIEAERERLAVTLRSIGDAVIVTDVTGMITMINKAAEEITGWSQQDACGKPLTEVFRLEDQTSRQTCPNPVDQAISSGVICGLGHHTSLKKRDGTYLVIEDSAAPIYDRENSIIGAVLVFRDTTAKHRMEEELMKMEKLQSVGLLAGGIAHDFNNLLMAILGNISLAKMQMDPASKAFKRLAEAEAASTRATDLTYQLLTFAKGGTPVRQASSIEEIIRECASFTLSGTNVAARYEVMEEIWNVDIDPGQISQVFNNLIINAVHAMPNGGTIFFQIENAVLAENMVPMLGGGMYVKILVKDTGVGIPPEHIGRIFEPYFTTKQQGSGLGLASAFSIIRRHDGYLTVESQPGQGTSFTIYLPATPLKPVADAKTGENIEPGQGRILVMDDEEMVLDVASEMLKALGYRVICAKNGEEAIILYAKGRKEGDAISAVIMDLTVPGGMGGKEAVGHLRRLDPDLVAIVSSGYSNDPVMAEHARYGFNGVIVKPYTIERLGRALREAVGKP